MKRQWRALGRPLLIGLPLLPLAVDGVVMVTGGGHDTRQLLWGPIVLVAIAPVVLWLGREPRPPEKDLPRNGRIHAVPPRRKKGRQ